jgi:hypothetical protein
MIDAKRGFSHSFGNNSIIGGQLSLATPAMAARITDGAKIDVELS